MASQENLGFLRKVDLPDGKEKKAFEELSSYYAQIYPVLKKNFIKKSIIVWLSLLISFVPVFVLCGVLIKYPNFVTHPAYSAMLVVMAFSTPLLIAGVVMFYVWSVGKVKASTKRSNLGSEFMKHLDAFTEAYFSNPHSGFYDEIVYNGSKDTVRTEQILASLWLPINSLALYAQNESPSGQSFQLLFVGGNIELWEGPFPDPENGKKKPDHLLPKI